MMTDASRHDSTAEMSATDGAKRGALNVDFLAYPKGWFRISFSDEIKPGKTKTVHYFGQDIVIFRGQNGVVSVVDPFCPHLGAHLGVGSEVVDNRLRCAFHGWTFDTKGQLASVPLAKTLPKRACLRTWAVQEKYGFVFVYHHFDGEAPTYAVPDIPLFEDGERWGEPTVFRKVIKSTIYELSENAVDRAHFGTVHGSTCPSRQDSHMKQITMEETEKSMHIACLYPLEIGPIRLEARVDIHMLDTVISCITGEGGVSYGLAALPTPIDLHTVENVYTLFTRRRPRGVQWLQNEIVSRFISGEIENDRPIWENKRFTEHPILSDFDGPIMKFRKWFSQYYPEKAAS